MQKIDAHQHFWQFDPVRDSWIDGSMPEIQRNFLPDDLEPILKKNSFAGCIVVQSDQSEAENAFQLKNADKNSIIKGVVGWVDLSSPKVEERLEYYHQFKSLKGFRHILQAEPDASFMLQKSFMNGISKLQKFGFTYDLLIFPKHLQNAKTLVQTFSDQPFVIDHVAKPDIKNKNINDWKKDILAIAKLENVSCKVSGMVTEANWKNWQTSDFTPYLDVVFEAFSAKRVMFGSDWPVCNVAGGYEKILSIVQNYTSTLTKTSKIYFGEAVPFNSTTYNPDFMSVKTVSTKINLPPVIWGTSGLGNIYQVFPYETKLAIVKAYIQNCPGIPVFDSAGKYGAGLALEVLGKCLRELNIKPENVIISNKLAWFQTELTTPEPTFERDIWKGLNHDAVQKISYEGISQCFEQGNQLLKTYVPQMVSVHDPDEYLAAATDDADEKRRYKDILDAYRALTDLKKQGKVKSIGVGSKQWKVIQRIAGDIDLDWVMIANSLTLKSHPQELINFIGELHQKNVSVINSAVFNGGFLTGSDFYNYEEIDPNTEKGQELHNWRNAFFALCKDFNIQPAEACFDFGFNIPGVTSVALSTSKPEKVKSNIEMATKEIPVEFWKAMQGQGLLEKHSTSFIGQKS